MVLGFFHIVPDGWALPEPFQHRGEGEQEEKGTFFIFLPLAISLRSQKAILQLIFLPPFTRAFCKGTGIPL